MTRSRSDSLPPLRRRDAARLLGISLRTFATLEADGVLAPARRGRGGRASLYDAARLVADFLEYERRKLTGAGQPGAEARSRREEAQAKLTEQLIATRARTLLPADEVARVWGAEVAAVRAIILSAPVTHADKVHRAAVLEGVVGVERALKALAHEVLRELADPDRPIAVAS